MGSEIVAFKGRDCLLQVAFKTGLTVTAILMQNNFSEWPIYIPFIAYNEILLFLRENDLSLKLANSYFITWHDWQNGSLCRKLLYKLKAISPKPLNQFT